MRQAWHPESATANMLVGRTSLNVIWNFSASSIVVYADNFTRPWSMCLVTHPRTLSYVMASMSSVVAATTVIGGRLPRFRRLVVDDIAKKENWSRTSAALDSSVFSSFSAVLCRLAFRESGCSFRQQSLQTLKVEMTSSFLPLPGCTFLLLKDLAHFSHFPVPCSRLSLAAILL